MKKTIFKQSKYSKRIPKTNKECYALLDEMLSDEYKQVIIEEEILQLHFTLGLWIRNNWIHPQSKTEINDLMKTFGRKQFFYIEPDDISEVILNGYRRHLKRLSKKKNILNLTPKS